MEQEDLKQDFVQKVEQELTPNGRELWGPIAREFITDGPDSVKTYLELQKEYYVNNINNLLEDFGEE